MSHVYDSEYAKYSLDLQESKQNYDYIDNWMDVGGDFYKGEVPLKHLVVNDRMCTSILGLINLFMLSSLHFFSRAYRTEALRFKVHLSLTRYREIC